METIVIASDHAGIALKEDLKDFLKRKKFEPLDMGTDGEDSVDYPDYGILVAEMVSRGEVDRGILICGTGIGMSIVANKFRRVRAALVSDVQSARMAKEHNDANILVIGSRVVNPLIVRDMVSEWLFADFGGGRHQQRLDKIFEIEDRMIKGYPTQKDTKER
ncbi:MAG: ribose 5-phosphate isomerase B [Deltaproteobacteria bacterium]|nr:ribose 5-phosphate isomerase B [Deltaproteobacteria bacterium]